MVKPMSQKKKRRLIHELKDVLKNSWGVSKRNPIILEDLKKQLERAKSILDKKKKLLEKQYRVMMKNPKVLKKQYAFESTAEWEDVLCNMWQEELDTKIAGLKVNVKNAETTYKTSTADITDQQERLKHSIEITIKDLRELEVSDDDIARIKLAAEERHENPLLPPGSSM